ncbi:MAG: hypothetical protein ACYTFK_06820 [Planctomycetota bacterium]|jgi:hypothetical protein
MNQIDKTAVDFNKTWRYKTGLAVFVIGNLMVLGSPLIAALGLPAKYIPVVIILGEVLIFGSIIFLGKKGFLEVKNKLKKLFKRKPLEELKPVGRFRHVLGLIMVFAVPLILNITVIVFGYYSYTTVTPQEPFAQIWGMNFEQQKTFFFTLMFADHVCFVIGLFVLGGLWWERFSQLFTWPGKE